MNTDAYIEQLSRMKKIFEDLKKLYDLVFEHKSYIQSIINRDNNRVNKLQLDRFFEYLTTKDEQVENVTLQITNISESIKNEAVDPQYEKFLNQELLNIDWNRFYYLSDHNLHLVRNFLGDYQEKIFNQEDYGALQSIAQFINSAISDESTMIDKISTILTVNKLKGIDKNIVIIGANGSGKSRFARNLEGKVFSGILMFPAQKVLVYRNNDSISLNTSMIQTVRNFQKQSKSVSDHNFIQSLSSDLNNLILALLEDRTVKADMYYTRDKKVESILDQTIKIWGGIVTHREIHREGNYKLVVKTKEGTVYDFNELSDGEKAIFYYIGHVLIAEENSYFVIDEPENHLHLSVCSKLWDILEQQRPDCKFVYITHDLNFAVSRSQKRLIWNKSYVPPFSWEFEIVEEDDTIPEILMLELMGSRKNIIFCEGDDRNSLDYKIYSRLFENFNVIPVNGHDDVIRYCLAFNRNPLLARLNAYGIIDGDTWTPEEINSKRRDNIYVLPYNEIENIMCEKAILQHAVTLLFSDDNGVDEFINEFFRIVEREKDTLSVKYANGRINNHLKHNLFTKTKNIEELKSEIASFLGGNHVDKFNSEFKAKIEKDLAYKDYDSLIKYVSLKKRLTKELGNQFIVKDYEERFLRILNKEDAFKYTVYQNIVEPYLKGIIEHSNVNKN